MSNLPPPTRKRVSAQHTLDRVRNNQRRHRAHRREYTATLEQKLAHAEQRITDLKDQVDALKAELDQYQKQDASSTLILDTPSPTQPSARDLELLLPDNLLGLELLDPTSLHNGECGNDIGGNDIHNAGDHTISDALGPIVPLNQPATHITRAPIAAAASWSSSVGGGGCSSCSCNIPDIPLPELNQQQLISAYNHNNHDFDPGNRNSSTLSLSSSYIPPSSPPVIAAYLRSTSEDESTMPCTEAYVLIEQQNFKGVHQRDIASWLWRGFRESPDPGMGCRVKTDLLFGLLAFISGV